MTLRAVSAAIILFVSAAIAEARTVYQAHDGNFMWNNFCVLNNQWNKQKQVNLMIKNKYRVIYKSKGTNNCITFNSIENHSQISEYRVCDISNISN